MSFKFFLSMSYQHRHRLEPVASTVASVMQQTDHELLPVFVYRQDDDNWTKAELMNASFQEIDRCNAMIVEMSTKEVGVGIEMVYAKAKGLPIIGIRQVGSESSLTMEGTLSLPVLEYENTKDLAGKFPGLLQQLAVPRR